MRGQAAPSLHRCDGICGQDKREHEGRFVPFLGRARFVCFECEAREEELKSARAATLPLL